MSCTNESEAINNNILSIGTNSFAFLVLDDQVKNR
jgi:hypothetical protein